MKKFVDFIKESKYFENTKIVGLTKELAKEYLDEIKELNIRESSGRKEGEWRLWSDEDILMDIDMKWDVSFLILLNNKLIGFQINTRKKTMDNTDFIHTNRVLIDKEYRNYKLFWELYQKLYKTVRDFNIKYITCFTPFENVKNLNTDLLGMKLVEDEETLKYFMPHQKYKYIKDGLIYGKDHNLYLMIKKLF